MTPAESITLRVADTLHASDILWPYIESWCDRHGTRARLEEVRQSVPKI